MRDTEANRFTARAARYARVGVNMSGVAARMASGRFFGANGQVTNAAALTQALGGLKGPMMKVAQMMATIPDLLPPEYVEELQKLQSDAPPMGAAFVKRRMQAELGADWQQRFGSFDLRPAAAASLGQVQKATAKDGTPLACKLQYPDMQSAVEADLHQLDFLFGLQRQFAGSIDTREIAEEIGARLREELDYQHEARNAALYADILEGSVVRVPAVHPELSTKRLLTLGWLEGTKLLAYKDADQETRNRLAQAMFTAWWRPMARYRRHPRRPASRQLHRLQRRVRRSLTASTCSTSAASESSRRALPPAWSNSTAASCTATMRRWSTPTSCGASRSCRRTSSRR